MIMTTINDSSVFDNLDGKFLARLREISSNTRTTSDGKAFSPSRQQK
jgi:hypothetical protein